MKRHIFYIAAIAAVAISGAVSTFATHAHNHGMSSATASEATASKPSGSKTTVKEMSPDDPAPKAVNRPVVIDFYATWCGPCHTYKPIFDKIAEEYANKATFIRVDVDKCRDLAEKYNITSIPTTIILTPDGKTYTSVGLMNEARLRNSINTALK